MPRLVFVDHNSKEALNKSLLSALLVKSGGLWGARRGRTIRVVAFRASHPAKPPPRQGRFIQRFPKSEMNGQLPDSGSM
jgi:hypothetical protein